jgi:hypothetical protein
MRLTLLTAAALSTLLPLPALAQEQSNCAPFDMAAAFHAEKLNETRVAQGLSGDGTQIFMIFAYPNGETWSVVVVGSGGIACLKARGTDWQVRHDAPAVPEQGS